MNSSHFILPALLATVVSPAWSALPVKVSPGGADWPSYRGPNGNGVTTADIGKPWDTAGPKQLWKVDATNGFSSIAVSGNLAATLMTRDHEGTPTEFCVALDAATGKELWAMPLKTANYDHDGGKEGTRDNSGGDGPRSTPTIDGGMVFVYGSNLDLHCFDGKDGKVVWQKDIVKDFGGKNIRWMNATSPVIEGDLVIVGGGGAGQSMLAFNKKDGSVKWKAGDETITHATPTAATLLGERQIVFFMKSGLVSVSPKDGKILWQQTYTFKISTAASPIVSGDIVYCSAGYDVGSAAWQVKKKGSEYQLTELWKTPGNDLANHWSTPVAKDGYLYGMFQFKKHGTGPVKCVELKTGQVKWSKDGFGPGNVILSGEKLLALSDKGELVLIEAKPGACRELARADVLDGKCWSTPTLAGGRIFARSTKQAAAFEVRK